MVDRAGRLCHCGPEVAEKCQLRAEMRSERWGCGRFFVPSYAAQPSLRRYSSGLSHPSERLILPEQ